MMTPAALAQPLPAPAKRGRPSPTGSSPLRTRSVRSSLRPRLFVGSLLPIVHGLSVNPLILHKSFSGQNDNEAAPADIGKSTYNSSFALAHGMQNSVNTSTYEKNTVPADGLPD